MTSTALSSSTRRVTWSSKDIRLVKQDLPCMNPCWLGLIPWLSCTCPVSALRMNHSIVCPQPTRWHFTSEIPNEEGNWLLCHLFWLSSHYCIVQRYKSITTFRFKHIPLGSIWPAVFSLLFTYMYWFHWLRHLFYVKPSFVFVEHHLAAVIGQKMGGRIRIKLIQTNILTHDLTRAISINLIFRN